MEELASQTNWAVWSLRYVTRDLYITVIQFTRSTLDKNVYTYVAQNKLNAYIVSRPLDFACVSRVPHSSSSPSLNIFRLLEHVFLWCLHSHHSLLPYVPHTHISPPPPFSFPTLFRWVEIKAEPKASGQHETVSAVPLLPLLPLNHTQTLMHVHLKRNF